MKEVGFLAGALKENDVKLLSNNLGMKNGISEISFELSEKWEKLYGTFRGLSELYKSPVAYLKSNHNSKSFTLYFKAEAKQEVKAFLELLFQVLNKEMHFKNALKQLISARDQYEKKNKILVKDLF